MVIPAVVTRTGRGNVKIKILERLGSAKGERPGVAALEAPSYR